jgi:hypothetical protein
MRVLHAAISVIKFWDRRAIWNATCVTFMVLWAFKVSSCVNGLLVYLYCQCYWFMQLRRHHCFVSISLQRRYVKWTLPGISSYSIVWMCRLSL